MAHISNTNPGSEELEQDEQIYRELVERGSDVIYKMDTDGRLIYLNDVAARKLGLDKSEILGRSFTKFIFPEWVPGMLQGYREFITQEWPEFYFEFPLKDRNGKRLWVGQHMQLIRKKDGKREVRAFAKDITERRKIEKELKSAELRLSNLIMTLQSGILLEDENRCVVLTNQYFCDLFGLPGSPDDLTGMDCREAAELSKDLFKNPDNFIYRINQLLAMKELRVADELHLKDGRIFERDYIPIYHNHKYLGHLWQYRDMTESKQVQQKLMEARREAEEAREAEKQFLAHMSHEIRTPLNAIIGMLDLLMGTELSDEQKEYLEIQKSATDILSGLINDVLDIAKIESGKMEVVTKKLDLNSILENVRKTFHYQLNGKNVDLMVRTLPELDYYLMSDPILLNQVLFNLMGNAVKFTEEGQIRFETSIVHEEEEALTLRFEIRDTGIGIAEEKLTSIFDKFRQGDEQVSLRYGGTGLGLAITKRIVDLLGGQIVVESTLGEGSTFLVTLRFQKSHEKIHKQSAVEVSRHLSQRINDKKILVAEDNVMNTFYLKRILEKIPLAADFTVNGKEAVDKANEQAYDLILMDVRMPEMNGLQATKLIRREGCLNRDTPILALTASTLKEQIDEALSTGMTDYLPKPFTSRQLLLKLQELLDGAPEEGSITASLDEAILKELYGQDKALLRDMIRLFEQENWSLFRSIRPLLEGGQFAEARERIHQLASSFSLIGLPLLTPEMEKLERLCDEGSTESLCLYFRISEALDKAWPAVRAVM